MQRELPDDTRKITDETLDYLRASTRSLQQTIADARRVIQTSRTVMKQAHAMSMLPVAPTDE